MYSFLPDELLKEILAPALQVPDDSFACTHGQSPFSNYNRTTSAYLLVCKDWLRVATPLLYSVVVLRSKAQIQALDSAIESTPVLGGFIKKIRIESGYCAPLLSILRSANNLTDLCLALEVYSSDNVAAICKGFGFISPQRLIIYDLHRNNNRSLNQKTQQLVKSTEEYIQKWEKLTVVVLPNWFSYWHTAPNLDGFVDAICKSKSVEVVYISYQSTYPNWLDRLSTAENIKKIVVRQGYSNSATSFALGIKANAKMRKLVHWLAEDPHRDAAALRPHQPMTIAPPTPAVNKNWLTEFPDAVWFNILFYALDLPELEQSDFSKFPGFVDYPYQHQYRRRLACVCKKFHELVIPLYYRCILITGDDELTSLATVLSRKKDTGRQLRTLLTFHKSHNSTLTQNLNKVLEYAPNLQRVSTNVYSMAMYHTGSYDVFDWPALCTLSQKAGPRLVELAINLHRPTQPKAPDPFYKLTALKHLDYSSSAKFNFEPSKVKKKALPNLESITCSSINNTLLSFLSCMDLPKIRRASFHTLDKCEGAITFLRKHGSKIRSLELGFLPGVSVFDICPNLEEFSVPHDKPGFGVAEFFSSTDEHPLEVLHIKTRDVARGAEKEKFKYIGGLDLSNFTSLREVRVDKCTWPTTENEIKKSHWVTWAERLKELYEVDIVDTQGQKWRPRLRARSEK